MIKFANDKINWKYALLFSLFGYVLTGIAWTLTIPYGNDDFSSKFFETLYWLIFLQPFAFLAAFFSRDRTFLVFLIWYGSIILGMCLTTPHKLRKNSWVGRLKALFVFSLQVIKVIFVSHVILFNFTLYLFLSLGVSAFAIEKIRCMPPHQPSTCLSPNYYDEK